MAHQVLRWRDDEPQATAKWVDGEAGRPVLPRASTLLDLVQTVQDYANTDDEVVAVIANLLRSGRVTLRGIFANRPVRVLGSGR
jgi:hypothetical protein